MAGGYGGPMEEKPPEQTGDDRADEDEPREKERGILELFHKRREDPDEDAPLERDPAE
ncbi:MAG: hypothetical protein JWM06_1863 [Actinomycetia bacterium]|nr:hypothetical protein [Actinomycetes bacterium]